MSQELSTEISPEIINSLILTGDMSKLTAGQQTQYYTAICKTLGLNPLTQPFAIIMLQGKKTLYALKGCTQQLADVRQINTEVKDRKTADSVYIVSVRATMKDGRFTDEDGIVSIVGLKGAELANAMMKAVTKAKRRAVLALCGLGMPDETEIEDTPHAASQVDTGKSRVEQIIEAQVDPKQEKITHEEEIVKSEKVAADVKKDRKSEKKEPEPAVVKADNGTVLPEGCKLAQGVITTPAKLGYIGDAKTPKWNFTMGENKYGTFDKSIFEGISAILDLQKETPILINIVYKERLSGEKILRDIVSFKQAEEGKDVPI